MKTFFSRTHREAIDKKNIPLSFPYKLRFSIVRILKGYSDYSEYEQENTTFLFAEETLKTFYGQPHLMTYNADSKRVPGNFEEVILNGFPGHVLDCIEAWFDRNPGGAKECEEELNDLFMVNDSPWRIVNGTALLVDSEFLHTAVRAKSLKLLKDSGSMGALEEYQAAIKDLQSGEVKDAIIKAHKSVESVMKTVLGVSEHITFGALLTRLIKSGIIPEYYDEFLKHFEKLMLGSVKERNLPGRGHGQGTEATVIPRSLAEFAVNLAGTVNLFILQQWIDTKKEKDKKAVEDDIPF